MDRPNILLLAVDTLRADHLGCYGYDQPTSPHIDAFARSSVLYSNCYSHAPWTIPSFTSILSGLDPIRHRVVASPWNVPNYRQVGFDDLTPTLPEILRDAGYRCLAVDNLVEMASHPSWFVRGFHHYINLTDRLFIRHHHVLAAQVTDEFLAWKGLQQKTEPWFAFLHYWDPHLPYNYPPEYDEKLPSYRPAAVAGADGRPFLRRRGYADEVSDDYLELIARYDRSIRYADDEIHRLLATLAASGADANTIIVLTGDHGESMVEHGVLFEHALLYDATIHVPLIIRDGRRELSGRRDELVQHHDILPTLMKIADVPWTGYTSGCALAPFAARPPSRDYAISMQDGGAALRSIRTADRKLICHLDPQQDAFAEPARVERFELYDVESDPDELHDLSEARPEEVRALLRKLEAWRKAALENTTGGDPLLDPRLRVDFRDYPGDPVLVDFYASLPARGRAQGAP